MRFINQQTYLGGDATSSVCLKFGRASQKMIHVHPCSCPLPTPYAALLLDKPYTCWVNVMEQIKSDKVWQFFKSAFQTVLFLSGFFVSREMARVLKRGSRNFGISNSYRWNLDPAPSHRYVISEVHGIPTVDQRQLNTSSRRMTHSQPTFSAKIHIIRFLGKHPGSQIHSLI